MLIFAASNCIQYQRILNLTDINKAFSFLFRKSAKFSSHEEQSGRLRDSQFSYGRIVMMRGVVVYFMQGVCRYLEKNKLTVSTLFFVSNF